VMVKSVMVVSFFSGFETTIASCDSSGHN
jgi:hypothetical protein